MRTYRIRVSFRKIGFTNSDDDMTLKVFDPGRPQIGMEVEFPDTRCPAAGSSAKKAEMARARTALIRACGAQERLVTGRGIVTGVGFFDIPHSEPYIAPNSIELHPVLAIRILSCKKGPLQPD